MRITKLAAYTSSVSNWLKLGKSAAKHVGIKLPKLSRQRLMKTRKYRSPGYGRRKNL